jgi:hypothetical protein
MKLSEKISCCGKDFICLKFYRIKTFKSQKQGKRKMFKKMRLGIIQAVGMYFLIIGTSVQAQSSTCSPACTTNEICCNGACYPTSYYSKCCGTTPTGDNQVCGLNEFCCLDSSTNVGQCYESSAYTTCCGTPTAGPQAGVPQACGGSANFCCLNTVTNVGKCLSFGELGNASCCYEMCGTGSCEGGNSCGPSYNSDYCNPAICNPPGSPSTR